MSQFNCERCLAEERQKINAEEFVVKSQLVVAWREECEDLKQQLVYWKRKYTTLLEEIDDGS